MPKGISLGQIPEVFRIALVIGITVGISYIVMVAFQNSSLVNTGITNESITFTTAGTNYTFVNTPVTIVTNVMNTTTVCGLSNFTYNSSYITLLAGGLCVQNKAYSVTYNYSATSRATTGIGYMLTFMDNIASYMPIVSFVILGVIILYLLNMYNSRLKSKSKGGA